MTKLSVASLQAMKRAGERIACLTCYDASFARLLDGSGIDVLLVGDSLGMVLQGWETTLKVKLADMIYHCSHVSRGIERALVLGDMPFMSYASPSQALHNAARLMSEGGAQAVKLEGGAWLAETVRLLSERGVPVCAHLGLLPQSIHKLGGYRVQGRGAEAAAQIQEDARILKEAGAVMLVLECVPRTLAAEITAALEGIPVIGIGAGSGCDGQVLVLYDMLGISGKSPKFSKDFLASHNTIKAAIEDYVRSVKAGEFPAQEHGFD
ncbi:MAG TPA: 3-methyl-2-oxobutanoate hydroxymethyltransferase [Gammaproteobacteria bacterium]|nr:3-methyl-2-oxobutanoate hydroxymethyltransferase [Gammaproteobacteria bacterium]